MSEKKLGEENLSDKNLRKVKKGKNCIFWSFSGKKQFFPYCYDSVFGFFETRSSKLTKDYLAKGLTLFNSDFYKDEKLIKNYQSKTSPEKVFNAIYSNRSIRPFTTYSSDLDQYKNPDFLKFYFDNFGYLYVNSIIFELAKNKNANLNFFCSKEKISLLNPIKIGEEEIDKEKIYREKISKDKNESKSKSQIDYLIDLYKKEKKLFEEGKKEERWKKKNEKKKKNFEIFYFETFPYWLKKVEILKLENFYEENKNSIENFFLPLKFLYKYYFDKFYIKIGLDSSKIVERYINIQKAWIYLISCIKNEENFIILDGSYSDFKFFPFLTGFLPQKGKDDQIFNLYLFGDNLTFGMGKNIIILNEEENLTLSQQPYFNPFGFELLYANLRRCIWQPHYSVLLRYLYIIESRKNVEVIGPYLYFEDEKPFTIPLKIPDEIFYFLLRELPNKK
jgi:hypothetical protein